MIKSGDFTPLSKMHSNNLNNAMTSMKSGVSPVIIDNTNIKQNEAKPYVIAALELGYSDNNIKFVDIGTAGLEAKELALRNTHGVPLEKIEQMIASHTAQGPLTLKSVLSSKDMYKQKEPKILYSAIVLTEKSKSILLEAVGSQIPEGWNIFTHHMTIVFGKGLPDEMKHMLGQEIELTGYKLGISNMVMSVLVSGFDMINDKPPHITIAVNTKEGGKPVDSNLIINWIPIAPIKLIGIITEVTTSK